MSEDTTNLSDFERLQIVIPLSETTTELGSALSRSTKLSVYQPRATLVAATKARIHDRLAWENHYALTHREKHYVVPQEEDNYIPSASLMSTTAARNNDALAWNEHVQQLRIPTQIKTDFAPVKEHLLRMTKARVQEIEILRERMKLKDLAQNPLPPSYVLSKFMPSDHLLSSTKAREQDMLAWKMHEKISNWHYSAEIVMNLPPISERLLVPTQSQISAINAWALQKEQAPFEDDIWWTLRRPTPCSTYHHRHAAELPSKVTEVTISFLLSTRLKFVEDQQLQEIAAVKHTSETSEKYRNMAPIASTSHLLTSTTATVQSAWGSTNQPVVPKALDLPGQTSYPNSHRVQSKWSQATTATLRHRWSHFQRHHSRHRHNHHSRTKKHIRPLTEVSSAYRLLRPTKAVLLGQTQPFAGRVQDECERRWNIHTSKGRIAENPFDENNRKQAFPRMSSVSNRHSLSFNQQRCDVSVEESESVHVDALKVKHNSWTSAEVRAVVAKAVQAALQEAEELRSASEVHQRQAQEKNKRHAQEERPSDASVVSQSSRQSSVASKKSENPFPSSLKKSTLWSAPALNLTAPADSKTLPVPKTIKPKTARKSLPSTNKLHHSALMKPTVNVDHHKSFNGKLEALMMSPIRNCEGPLIFEDLTGGISPMSTFDAGDDHRLGEPSFGIVLTEDSDFLNLSAPTIDQNDSFPYHLSLETTNIAPLFEKKSEDFTKSFTIDSSSGKTSSKNLLYSIMDSHEHGKQDVSDEETVVMPADMPPMSTLVESSVLIA